MKDKNKETAAEENRSNEAGILPETAPKTNDAASQPEPQPKPEPEPAPESTSEPKPESTAETEPNTEPDLEQRLAEAENRGYLRGRNERIEELMKEPATLERQPAPPSAATSPGWDDWQADSQPMILNNPHVSIWDK